MEVHTHTHTARKKWTHYFWEFLMLFLAVTLGFFVENWREHIIENNRASELAKSLYYELYSDSINLEQAQRFRLKRERGLKYITQYIIDSNLSNLSKDFCPRMVDGLLSLQKITFDPRDAILEQLKSSGMLRYFKDDDFQKGLAELSLSISIVRLRNERERVYYNQFIVPFLQKHLDQDWIDKMVNSEDKMIEDALIEYETKNRVVPCYFKDLAGLNKEETASSLKFYNRMVIRHTRLQHYKNYHTVNHLMQSLLRTKYKIK